MLGRMDSGWCVEGMACSGRIPSALRRQLRQRPLAPRTGRPAAAEADPPESPPYRPCTFASERYETSHATSLLKCHGGAIQDQASDTTTSFSARLRCLTELQAHLGHRSAAGAASAATPLLTSPWPDRLSASAADRLSRPFSSGAGGLVRPSSSARWRLRPCLPSRSLRSSSLCFYIEAAEVMTDTASSPERNCC